MKEFVQRKQGPLYVVSAPRSASDVFDFTPISLDLSFENWLQAVETTDEESNDAPARLVTRDRPGDSRPQLHSLQLCAPAALVSKPTEATAVLPAGSILTTQDYIKVMLATIREGFRHVQWPKEVVARFLANDVIAPARRSSSNNKSS